MLRPKRRICNSCTGPMFLLLLIRLPVTYPRVQGGQSVSVKLMEIFYLASLMP
jgi:hypothetical protein